jgi:hypothetical protein
MVRASVEAGAASHGLRRGPEGPADLWQGRASDPKGEGGRLDPEASLRRCRLPCIECATRMADARANSGALTGWANARSARCIGGWRSTGPNAKAHWGWSQA